MQGCTCPRPTLVAGLPPEGDMSSESTSVCSIPCHVRRSRGFRGNSTATDDLTKQSPDSVRLGYTAAATKSLLASTHTTKGAPLSAGTGQQRKPQPSAQASVHSSRCSPEDGRTRTPISVLWIRELHQTWWVQHRGPCLECEACIHDQSPQEEWM